jgi:hypothetical protein
VGQKSSIDRLSKTLREKLIELLQNPAVTQLEVVELINSEAGKAVVSKSSVNRYKQKLDKFAEKSREAREVADAYIEKYGADSRNKLGKVANEYIRLMVFDLITELEELKESSEDINPRIVSDIIYKVSRAVKDLEQTEKLNAERTEEIRKAALEDAAGVVEAEAKSAGLNDAALEVIKKKILGI